MSIRQTIKKNALGSLKHHWGRAIGILLFLVSINALFLLLEQFFCYLLSLNVIEEPALVVDLFHGRIQITSSMAIVTAAFAIVSFVLMTPLLFGMTKWYFHQVGGERPALQTLFSYFYSVRDLFRSIALRIMITVRAVLWGLLFAIPSGLIFWAIQMVGQWKSDYSLLVSTALLLLEGVVTLIMALMWFCWIQRYFLVDYLFVSEAEMGLHAMIKKSVRIMKKNRVQTAALYGSFLPWILLSVLVVPLLFVLPYLFSSTAINARVLLERDAREPNGRNSAAAE
ncbi:MAG: DUF975 family protein [Candidatus Merdivicinus sp.]